MDKFGDSRRTKLVASREARALTIDAILPVEPVTVVLSMRGWVRSIKGHEVELDALNFKGEDGLRMASKGKNNKDILFPKNIYISFYLTIIEA